MFYIFHHHTQQNCSQMLYQIVLKHSLLPVTYFILLFSMVCFIVSASSPPSFPFFIYFIPATFKDMLNKYS